MEGYEMKKERIRFLAASLFIILSVIGTGTMQIVLEMDGSE
jgi:hypothetical protein